MSDVVTDTVGPAPVAGRPPLPPDPVSLLPEEAARTTLLARPPSRPQTADRNKGPRARAMQNEASVVAHGGLAAAHMAASGDEGGPKNVSIATVSIEEQVNGIMDRRGLELQPLSWARRDHFSQTPQIRSGAASGLPPIS